MDAKALWRWARRRVLRMLPPPKPQGPYTAAQLSEAERWRSLCLVLALFFGPTGAALLPCPRWRLVGRLQFVVFAPSGGLWLQTYLKRWLDELAGLQLPDLVGQYAGYGLLGCVGVGIVTWLALVLTGPEAFARHWLRMPAEGG